MSPIISSLRTCEVDDGRWPEDYDECPVCCGLSIYIPTGRCRNGCDLGMDVRPLAYVLDNTLPDLWALILPGESFEDVMARREAARDIADDLLAEFGATAMAVSA